VKPDIIHVFNLGGLGGLLADWLHSQRLPVVHDVSDTELIRVYHSDQWFTLCVGEPRSFVKRTIKAAGVRLALPFLRAVPTPINLANSYFRSRFLKQQFAEAGFDVESAPIIYHGLQLPDLRARDEMAVGNGIVFSGRLSPEKGVHVFLKSLSLLKESPHLRGTRVTIIGPINDVNYWNDLQRLAKDVEPSFSVRFTGHLPRSQVLDHLQQHTMFVFPVLWDEPFSIALLEAMGLGLAVIATATGGSVEILVDGENCLVMPRNDPLALAAGIERISSDTALRHRISLAGRRTAKRFSLTDSINSIEQHMLKVADQDHAWRATSRKNPAMIG